MTEHAFQLHGFDDSRRLPVRVELRLITDERVEPLLPESFSAPRGFLSDEDVLAAECTRAAVSETVKIEGLKRSGFRAPRGFLGA